MMTRHGWAILLGCLCGGARAAEEAAAKTEGLRAWTSVNGNVVEAAFVREGDGKVFLRRADGSVISTAREKLSPDDLSWIDGQAARAANAADAKTQAFTNITSQKEKLGLDTYLAVKKIIVKTYADLTNNHRDDKSLAFLLRDANKVYGWANIAAECYPLPNGQKGRLKTLTCSPPSLVELREAVQIMRDKFTLIMPDPVVVKEVREYGMSAWEVQKPPEYVSRILLVKDPYSGKICRFVLSFPEPEK